MNATLSLLVTLALAQAELPPSEPPAAAEAETIVAPTATPEPSVPTAAPALTATPEAPAADAVPAPTSTSVPSPAAVAAPPSLPWSVPVEVSAVELSGTDVWRLGAGVGQTRAWSDAPRWAEGLGEPVGHLRLERDLNRVFPGLAANVGLNAWNQGELKGGAQLSLWVMDLALGANLTWPRDGLWRVLFPYVRAAVLLSYIQARASDDLAADLWAAPGLEAAGGVRLHFGRASTRDWGRLFLFGEASLDLRWPRRVRLEQPEEDEDPLVPAVPTRLGRLNLSGWGWQAGVGMAF